MAGEWGTADTGVTRASTAIEASTKFMRFAPAHVQLNGAKREYLVCYDSRTGMPHPFEITLLDTGRSGEHRIEVFDCTPFKELLRAAASELKVPQKDIVLRHHGRKLSGTTATKLGVLGLTPNTELTVQYLRNPGTRLLSTKEGATRSYKLRGVVGEEEEEAPPQNKQRGRRASQWENMVSKRGSIVGGASTFPAPRRKRLPKRRPTVRTTNMFGCYKNKAPISPSMQCMLYELPPKKKPEVQMEYADDGLYFRHEHDWKFRPYGKNEQRFEYVEQSNTLNNPYQQKHRKATMEWSSPWNLHLTNQVEMLHNEGTLVPAYSSLSDPYCAKFAQRLYGVAAFDEPAENEDDLAFYKRREESSLTNSFLKARRGSCARLPNTKETNHDFYKRQEQENSNTYQRARRRSIELIDQVTNDMKAPTASSRRKSVVGFLESSEGQDEDGDDGLMDHAAAAREATRRYDEANQLKKVKSGSSAVSAGSAGSINNFLDDPIDPVLYREDTRENSRE